MLWVVLEWLESVKFIKSHSALHFPTGGEKTKFGQTGSWHGTQFIAAYAHRARVFYEIATHGWDTELCGGGMTWNPYLAPYKNAITNQLFIAASVGMYLYFPGDDNTSPFLRGSDTPSELEPVAPHDPAYLKAAVEGYRWLKDSNMTNGRGLYVDGFHISHWRRNGTRCDIRNNMVYTYNQGVLLSGLRGLWESTGDVAYLEDGHQLARDAIRATGWVFESASAPLSNVWAGLGRNGILEERCDASGRCNQDGQTFKGIFFHHLTLFCEPLPFEPLVPGKTYVADKDLAHLHHQSCQEYALWTAHNARAAIGTRDGHGRYGTWWGARSGVEAVPLEDGAIDYRNNGSELCSRRWVDESSLCWSGIRSNRHDAVSNDPTMDHAHTLLTPDRPGFRRDPNERGRGRTVEAQGGGVRVLSALWELLNTA